MTYKGSNWTRGELGHAPERDPMIPCHECGEEYRYIGYWKPRYIDGKDWIPREVAWVCDKCLETVKAEYELHKKKERNAAITEFAP